MTSTRALLKSQALSFAKIYDELAHRTRTAMLMRVALSPPKLTRLMKTDDNTTSKTRFMNGVSQHSIVFYFLTITFEVHFEMTIRNYLAKPAGLLFARVPKNIVVTSHCNYDGTGLHKFPPSLRFVSHRDIQTRRV